MLNTILVEDHLMVNKFVFGAHPSWLGGLLPYRDIRRGDIIVFKYPKNPEDNYVKRVIGLPGDKIFIRGTRVFINDKELPENKLTVHQPFDAKADLEPMSPVQEADGATHTVYYSQTTDFEESVEEAKGPHGRTTIRYSGEIGKYGVEEPFVIPDGQYFCLGDNRDNSEDSRFWGTVPRENVIGRAMFVYWSINESEREDMGSGSLLSDIFKYTRWGRTGTMIK
jgi:signal peptidase I